MMEEFVFPKLTLLNGIFYENIYKTYISVNDKHIRKLNVGAIFKIRFFKCHKEIKVLQCKVFFFEVI